MVFNGDANNMDICTLADLPNKTNDTSFPLWKKAMYANMGLRAIFREIYKIYGGWTLQDTNVSGIDEVTTNLLNDGTQFYAFATAQWIAGVEYEDANGNKFPLIPITLEKIREMGYAEDEFYETPANPQYYRPVKNGIKIYPASDTAVTNGLIVKIGAQDISPFTPSSTTTQPGYDSLAGHEVVADFMAMKYSDENDNTNFPKRELAWQRGVVGIVAHYKRKFMEAKPAIRKGSMGSGYADSML
jgi:hypothetical protein